MADETSTCAPVGAVPDGGGTWVVAAGAVCDGQGKGHYEDVVVGQVCSTCGATR